MLFLNKNLLKQCFIQYYFSKQDMKKPDSLQNVRTISCLDACITNWLFATVSIIPNWDFWKHLKNTILSIKKSYYTRIFASWYLMVNRSGFDHQRLLEVEREVCLMQRIATFWRHVRLGSHRHMQDINQAPPSRFISAL